MKTHGHTTRNNHSRTYSIWRNMKTRCNNPNFIYFKNYGGRGIKVCDQWHTFDNFLADMGEAPLKHEIDRINNDLGYSPDNCRWVTRSQQARNKSDNHMVEYNGETRCIAGWAEHFGVKHATMWSRVHCGRDIGTGKQKSA